MNIISKMGKKEWELLNSNTDSTKASVYSHNLNFVYKQWAGTGMKGLQDVNVKNGRLEKLRCCEKLTSKFNSLFRAKIESDRIFHIQKTISKSFENCNRDEIEFKVLEIAEQYLISNNLLCESKNESKSKQKIDFTKPGIKIIEQLTGITLPPDKVTDVGAEKWLLKDRFCKLTVQGRPCIIVGESHEVGFWKDIEIKLREAAENGELGFFAEGRISPDQQKEFQGLEPKSKFLIGLENYPLKICNECVDALQFPDKMLDSLTDIIVVLAHTRGGIKVIQDIAHQSELAYNIKTSIIDNKDSMDLRFGIQKIFSQRDEISLMFEGRVFLTLVGSEIMKSIPNLSKQTVEIFQKMFQKTSTNLLKTPFFDEDLFTRHTEEILHNLRDTQFAKVIKSHISKMPEGMVIIHVGANHLKPLKKFLKESKSQE